MPVIIIELGNCHMICVSFIKQFPRYKDTILLIIKLKDLRSLIFIVYTLKYIFFAKSFWVVSDNKIYKKKKEREMCLMSYITKMCVIWIRINLVRICLLEIVKIALWSSKANVSRCQASRQIRASLDVLTTQLI